MSNPINYDVEKVRKIAFDYINNIYDEVQGLNLSLTDTYATVIFCLSMGAASVIDSFNKRCSVPIDKAISNHVETIKSFINENRRQGLN